MPSTQRWNHVNYAVAPARVGRIEECIDSIFGWEKFVSKPSLVAYRLGEEADAAALYLRPVPAADALADAIERIRSSDAVLGDALDGLERLPGDWADHTGFLTPSLEEWEERLARARDFARARPELRVAVVDVLRPGDGRAQTDYLYQAFIRLGLLGPWRNTFEMQAIRRP